MSFLGLFKLRDVTKSTIVVLDMTQHEFIKRISSVTDQTTNIGFMTKGKKFHGLVNNDRFRLKRIQTFRNEEFVIRGEIRTHNEKLIVDLEFIRGPIQTLLPTFFFILGPVILGQIVIQENLDWRYIPFISLLGLIIFWVFEMTKQKEIETIKELITEAIEKGAD